MDTARLFLGFLFAGGVITGQPYVISTIAGGTPQQTPVAATRASIPQPRGITADRLGNLYFISRNTVFKIDVHGVLTRIAGDSQLGDSGDGGPAISARLY